MDYTFVYPTRKANNVPSLIAGNRLEPRPRSVEFNRSLRAEIRDATWLLARQWQMKEFRAEDRGSPVSAQVELEYALVNQLRAGATAPVIPYDHSALPLDALVQAQAPVVDLALQLQMGRHWKRLLQASKLLEAQISQLLATYQELFPVAAPAVDPAPTDAVPYSLEYALSRTLPEAFAVQAAAAGRTIAGYDLYAWLTANPGIDALVDMSRATTFSQDQKQLLFELAQQLVTWYRRLYNVPAAGSTGAWSVPELAYQFSVAAPSNGSAPVVATTTEYYGSDLNWYTVDEEKPSANVVFSNDADLITRQSFRFVPTEIQFAGAPNARWWEFEDRKIDFGQITADSSDFGRMLLQEFMFLYHNDWFHLPYSVPSGSICTVSSLVVTDVFGESYRIEAAGANPRPDPAGDGSALEDDWGRWSLFALSTVGKRQLSKPQLFLPPTALNTQMGPLVEQVYLAREEATNLVWGVEKIIPNGLSRGTDGDSAAARVTEYLRSRAQAPTPLASGAKLEYKLTTAVAENWIPFIPRQEDGLYQLEQGEMLRQVDYLTLQPGNTPGDATDDTIVRPRTALLGLPADSPYLVHEREIPPIGMRIEGSFRRTRWYNGGTVLWYGRNRNVGRSGGSSGLAYDQLIPRPAASEVVG